MMVNLSLQEAMNFVREQNPSFSDEEVRVEALRIVKISNQSMDETMLKESLIKELEKGAISNGINIRKNL